MGREAGPGRGRKGKKNNGVVATCHRRLRGTSRFRGPEARDTVTSRRRWVRSAARCVPAPAGRAGPPRIPICHRARQLRPSNCRRAEPCRLVHARDSVARLPAAPLRACVATRCARLDLAAALTRRADAPPGTSWWRGGFLGFLNPRGQVLVSANSPRRARACVPTWPAARALPKSRTVPGVRSGLQVPGKCLR